jgi:RNase P/RNase MRP subunit p30
MFIDIVIPKNNEKAFISMAEKLGIQGLVFLYKSRPKDCKHSSGIYQRENGMFVAVVNNVKISFDAQTPDQLQEQGYFGVSFSSISGNGMKNAARNIRLCRKSKITVVAASLATTPFGMRSPHDFSSLLVCLGMTPGDAKKALGGLSEIIGATFK